MERDMPTRRHLIRLGGALAAGGLLLGVRLPSQAREVDASPAGEGGFVPNAFVRIDGGGRIALVMPHTEVGQGIYTSSAMLIGEELEVGLDQVTVEPAPPDLWRYMDPILYEQATGGSTSTRSDWRRLREAGAAARQMLVAAAAERWRVSPDACRVERGTVRHDESGRAFGYGELAADAGRQPVPRSVRLKDPSQFTLIGTSAKRIDTPSKVNGSAVFGIDVVVPDMKFATLAVTPVKGGRLVGMDEAAARRVPGVHDIVRVGDEAIAVVGDHMWAAKQGIAALNLEWNAGANAHVTSAVLLDAIAKASAQPGVVARHQGDAHGAIANSATRLEATYIAPFLSHSPMEPLNCTLHIRPEMAEIWVGTQVPVRAQKSVMAATGLPANRVIVHNQLMGGAFGRRLEVDSINVAALIARQVSYPVKIVWTREEDMRHDYYRPSYYDRVSAGLDGQGRLVGRTHRVTGPSIYARWAPAAFKGGLDIDAVDCAAETPYSIPNEHADYVRHEPVGVNTSWWRGVGPTHNLFVIESFVDELAHASGQEPVQFRRSMLGHNKRALAVLNLAAEKSGWGTAMQPRMGRGIGVQFAFGSYVSSVVEVAVGANGEIALHRVVIAADCGMIVNPDTVRAQLEGGMLMGLGTALYSEITLTGGAVDQSNFHDYRVLRINEVPKVEIHLVDSTEDPGGIGEAGTAAAAPALGNAIFAATGKRLRRLPLNGQLRGGSA